MKFLWIFEPDAIWCLIPAVSLLWALGGSGVRFLRKLGVPVLICVSALSLGVKWWLVAVTFGSIFALHSIPYGEDMRKKLGLPIYWFWLYLVGAVYSAAFLPLAFHGKHFLLYGLGVFISGGLFGGLTYTSQKFDFPRWKAVEIILGAVLGLQASWLLL